MTNRSQLRAGEGLLGCDVAFPVLHGPFGEDGTVQGVFEILDVPYVGAGVLASAACLDKVVFKELMAQAGLPQVGFVLVREGDSAAAAAALGFPCWVKPARLGSSVGIVRVAQESELAAGAGHRVRPRPAGHRRGERAGRRGRVRGARAHRTTAQASVPGEIVLRRGAGWYDYEAKYEPGGMELRVPAGISPRPAERLRALAVAAFAASGCSGLARADFFVDGEDVLLNELNTMPGFTADLGLREAVGGVRAGVRGARHAAVRDRDRALRARARLPLLRVWPGWARLAGPRRSGRDAVWRRAADAAATRPRGPRRRWGETATPSGTA